MTADTAATAASGPEPITGPGTRGDRRRHRHLLGRLPRLGRPARRRAAAPTRSSSAAASTPSTWPPANSPVYDSTPNQRRLHVACGNRRETVCPACSARLQARRPPARPRRAWPAARASPSTITAHPCVFATLTAPSFGPVHARRMRGKTVLPCRPRRDAKARRCPHGRDISCPTRHVEDDPRLGQPDVRRLLRLPGRGAVQRLRGRPVAPVHHLPAPPPGPPAGHHPEGPARPGPDPVRQGRRIPGTRRRPLPRRHPPGRPRRGLPAPARPASPPTLLCDAIGQAAAAAAVAIEHRRPGRQRSASARRPTPGHPPRHDLPGTGQALNGAAVANYIAKYATKTLDRPRPARPPAPQRRRHRALRCPAPLPAA